MNSNFDLIVVGGGIVGLAAARAMQIRQPNLRIALLEKEVHVAHHQTGNNSGVIHSGIYYKPGSLKAQLCVDGARRMYEFCAENGIAHQRCGKVIVAVSEDELPRLDELHRRAKANNVPGVKKIDTKELKKVEPNAAGIAALWSPNTGIADYRGVCDVLARGLTETGALVRLQTRVTGIEESANDVTVHTTQGSLHAEKLVSCGGLHADDIARMAGIEPDVQIVPFRGEYYFVNPQRRDLVRGLIYPVPNPEFPFLGVHFTITTSGELEAGPNAVLAFAREGYGYTNVNMGELARTLYFPGFQKLAQKWWRVGAYEYYRSLNKAEFVRSLQRLVPSVRGEDIHRGGAGVRAQAVRSDGTLVDDFEFAATARTLHVLNAPSPAATASLSIAEVIASKIEGSERSQ
ncbi:MAG: L-2-hydroxyglutarate oxidase [Chloroflexi bacterium]|nr:L-2-hydroxyglutarate oxidase [Chloroflexota bacterium]